MNRNKYYDLDYANIKMAKRVRFSKVNLFVLLFIFILFLIGVTCLFMIFADYFYFLTTGIDLNKLIAGRG